MERIPEQQLNVKTLEHRKSAHYIQEYADRSNLLISDLKAGMGSITIVFGRDTAEIQEEQAIEQPNGSLVMTPTRITAFRHDVASITLPEYAARGLAEAILGAIGKTPAENNGG